MLTTHSTQCMFNIPKSLAQQTVNRLLHEKRNIMPPVKSAGSNDFPNLLQKQVFTPFGTRELKGLFPKAGDVRLIGNEELPNLPKKNHAESKSMNQECEQVQTLQPPKKQEGKGKSGVGKTGEGIPLSEVKEHVLTQIHPDNDGAYGYLPNAGTAYDRPDFDFKNIVWAKKMHGIRKQYLELVEKLKIDKEKMTADGCSKKEIAEYVVDARNQQKKAARTNMTVEEREGLEARNQKKYGNPIGPDAQMLFDKYKKNAIKEKTYKDDDQIWNVVTEASMKTDDVINTLLGIS